MKATYATLMQHATPTAPHIHEWLPYREYDDEQQLYYNTRSIGFAKHLSPLSGANDELVTTLNRIVCNLPEGDKWDYQFVMTGDNRVAALLDANEHAASVRGGVHADLATQQKRYALYGAQHGFMTRLGSNYRFDLKNYDCAFFCSTSQVEPERLVDVKLGIETEFAQAEIANRPMQPTDFIAHLNDAMNFDRERTTPCQHTYNPLTPIHEQVLGNDSEFLINSDHIRQRVGNDSGALTETTLVHLSLKKLPSMFHLCGFTDCLASLDNAALSLKCPFRISVNFRLQETGKTKINNEAMLRKQEKWATTPMAKWMPRLQEEIQDRQSLQHSLDRDECKLATMTLTLTLFTDESQRKKDVAAAIRTFESAGLSLTPTRLVQTQTWLASLPFMHTQGMYKDVKKMGWVRTIKTTNLVNFLPIVAGRRDLIHGLLLPTMRNQINFFDPFNCGSDNYNIAVMAGSGAGKSFFMQGLAKSVHERMGRVWLLDKGDSYKKLTQAFGGAYMNHNDIKLNPFTHLGTIATKSQSDDQDYEGDNPLLLVINDITGLIAAMAAPNTELSDNETRAISWAIEQAWQHKKNATTIDDVRDALQRLAAENNNDQRYKDLAFQLHPYCTDGLFGSIFNTPSNLDPDASFTTLELEGFDDDVLRPVVFALIVNINQQMYLSGDRKTPKLCLIEEAWSLMKGNNRQSSAFIEKGYRTARKFGGSFASVTQGVKDFFASSEAEVAFNNSDIKFYLRQGDGFKDFIANNRDFFPPFEIKMLNSFKPAKTTGYSSVMIKAGGVTSFHRFFADPWTRALFSTEAAEYEYTDTLTAQGMPLNEAVTATARHFFPAEMKQLEALNNE